MTLIQLLLPSSTDAQAEKPLARTRQELVDAFGGVTAYTQAPAHGVWTSPEGHREHDNVVMVEILTDRFDRAWWRWYATELAKRFQQDEIHVRAMRVEVIHAGQP